MFVLTMYCTWKLNRLKEELKRGATCSGRKADLVERILYDRNFNFTDKLCPPEPVQTVVMVIPKDDYYKDINSKTPLPSLTIHQIQEYFEDNSKILVLPPQKRLAATLYAFPRSMIRQKWWNSSPYDRFEILLQDIDTDIVS